MDRPRLVTPPSFVLRPAIGRESVLASHAAPVDHLFSLVRPAVAPPPPPPPPRGLAGLHRAYSSELTPRSRTARPFPNLSTLQSKRLGTERAPADSAPRTGPTVRRQISGTEPRLDQPTDAMPGSAVIADPTKPSIPANARPHRAGSQLVPSRCARVEFDSVDRRYEVQSWIPAQWAPAHVQYLLWSDENGDSIFDSDEFVARPWVDQQTNNRGSQSLGAHDLRGRVRIEVRDTRARGDHRDVGLVNASLAVDAIRLRKVHR